MNSFSQKLSKLGIPLPETHIVLGSGFGNAIDDLKSIKDFKELPSIKFEDLDELPKATVPGHPGIYRFFEHLPSKKVHCFQVGRLHGYEGLPSREVVQTVMLPRLAGVKKFVLTNAAGSLTEEFRPGSAMIILDHVNLTGHNPLIGKNPTNQEGKEIGPRFPDMGSVYDVHESAKLRAAFLKNQLPVHEGIYLGLMGPCYETPAEVKLFAKWGLQAVGMSTVWESIVLKHSGATVSGASLISNLGCGLGGKKILTHEEILIECRKSAALILKSLFDYTAL